MAARPATSEQLPEGAGGEEADLHTLVPDSIFRQAERPGLLRTALEARAAAVNNSVDFVFSRLVAQCFVRYSKENVDLAAALLTLACLGEGKEISWANEPRLRFLLGLHAVREAVRYLPSEVSDVELAEADKWWCDSRTAACACLLLLCATRESLRQEREALCLLGALREVCDALGRSTGHDSMVWGCDLDPGNWGTQRTPPGSATSTAVQGLGAAVALEPAGVIDNPGTPAAAGAPAAVDPSPPGEERGDAPVAASETEDSSNDPTVVAAKDAAPDASVAPAEQSLNEAKVDQLMQKLDEQLQLLRQATPLLRQRAEQITDKEAAAVRKQLALVLDQQTDFFESNMQALRENLPRMQLPAGDLIFPGIGWPPPPTVAALAAGQGPPLGLSMHELAAARGTLQNDLAAALSLRQPAHSPADSAGQPQPPPAAGGFSSELEPASRVNATGDGVALAGKLAALAASKAPEQKNGDSKLCCGVVEEEGKVQAMWAVVRAAVPLLKQLTSGKLPEAPAAAAPELCRALSCLCCRTSPCGRTFAGHIFKECAAHIAKLLKSDASSVGPVALLSQLLLSELPAPSKARYPPIPPSTSLKISSVFVQLGVVEHLRQRLVYATDALTASSTAGRQLNGAGPSLDVAGGSWDKGSSSGPEAMAMATCEALSLFALNAASHRSLQAADTFQTTLSLLGSSPECHVSVEVEAMALELIRALAAHCPSVAESAALWGQTGLPALSAHLRLGHDTSLREGAAAALDAILRLHKTQAVKEVLAKGMRIRGLLDKYDAVRGENLRFFPELRHRVAKMLRVLAYDSGGAALPELLRPGKEGCVPWLVAELGNSSTHWCTRAELAAVLGSLARIPALSAAMARSRRSVAGKDIMLDPRAGIRKAGAMGPLMALLKEVTENKTHTLNNEIVVNALAGVIGVGITYIKDDEDILPILKTELLPQLLRVMDVKLMTGSEGQRKLMLGNATILAYCLRWPEFRDEFVRRGGHICATDLMLWCANNEPPAPAPGKDDFHMETVCTLVNIIGNAARSSVKALEYINEQGGLPIAARYLARAVALPPSNTSWYMGLSNGAAGLCDLQAVLVNTPKVAAAVAEICMVGLATTAHATRGPPKPDKARIDRLAYVVTSLSTLATYLKGSAPGAIADALERGTFQQLLDLRRTLHLSNATIGYLQAFVQSSRNPTKDAAMANANMCQLLEEEAREKEREAREAARKLKRRLKKAEARLRSQEEESASLRAALAATELDSAPEEGPQGTSTAAEVLSPATAGGTYSAQPPPAEAAGAVNITQNAELAPTAAADSKPLRKGKRASAAARKAAGKAAAAEDATAAGGRRQQNGDCMAHARDTSAAPSGTASDADDDAGSETALPDSWEAMAEDEDIGAASAAVDFGMVCGASPPNSAPWTTVGAKKTMQTAAPEGGESGSGKARPTTPSGPSTPASHDPPHPKQQKGWGRLPSPKAPPPAAPSSSEQQQQQSRQGPWGNGPAPPQGVGHRASLRAIAAAQNHTANMLKAQVGASDRPNKEATGPVSWSSVAAGSDSALRGLPPPAQAPAAAEPAQDSPAAWGGSLRPPARSSADDTAGTLQPPPPLPLPAAPLPELGVDFPVPSRSSQPSTGWGSREVSESGLQSPASSRLSAPGSPTASHATVRTLSSDVVIEAWARPSAAKQPQPPPAAGGDAPMQMSLADAQSPPAQGGVAPGSHVSVSPAQLPGNLSPLFVSAAPVAFTPPMPPPPAGSTAWDSKPVGFQADWSAGASPVQRQPPAAHSQAASVWGASPAVGTSPAAAAAPDLWMQQQQTAMTAKQSAGAALPDSLFGDSWASLNVPPGANLWSLQGSAGSEPVSAAAAAPPGLRDEIASAAARVSQLNPSAGVFNAPKSALSQAAFPAQAPEPPAHATQVHGVQQGSGLQDVLGSGGGSSIWGAPSVAAPTTNGSGWSSNFQTVMDLGGSRAAAMVDSATWGASPPFNDAPAFLSSLMQQVLPEEDALLPGVAGPSLHSSFLQQHHQQPLQQQQMTELGPAGSVGFQLGSLFTLPLVSSSMHAQQLDQRQVWQQQQMGGSIYAQPPPPGAISATPAFHPSPTQSVAVAAGLSGTAVRQGSTAEGLARQPPLMRGPPPPGLQAGYGQASTDKGPAQRPSDVVHAFAQASQQARAQANNIQRFAPAQTPSAAIAAAGGQHGPPGFRMPMPKQQPVGLPSERLGAMGGQARLSTGD